MAVLFYASPVRAVMGTQAVLPIGIPTWNFQIRSDGLYVLLWVSP